MAAIPKQKNKTISLNLIDMKFIFQSSEFNLGKFS